MEWETTYFNEKIQKTINNWPMGIRAFYARITERMVLFGPNLGMPFTRSKGEDLFEIRARGKEGIGRVFFCTTVGHKIVILHAFIKKTNKTPRKELDIARKRLSEVITVPLTFISNGADLDLQYFELEDLHEARHKGPVFQIS